MIGTKEKTPDLALIAISFERYQLKSPSLCSIVLTCKPAKDGSPRIAVKNPLVPYHNKMPAVNGVTHGAILAQAPPPVDCFFKSTKACPPVLAKRSRGVEYPSV
eukprot:scaffold9872_cov164-Amphora_coffeaeformis.AAC.3